VDKEKEGKGEQFGLRVSKKSNILKHNDFSHCCCCCCCCCRRVLKKKGRYDEAKPLYLKALNIIETLYSQEHIKIALISADLGDVYR
jgi:hypothetical protein